MYPQNSYKGNFLILDEWIYMKFYRMCISPRTGTKLFLEMNVQREKRSFEPLSMYCMYMEKRLLFLIHFYYIHHKFLTQSYKKNSYIEIFIVLILGFSSSFYKKLGSSQRFFFLNCKIWKNEHYARLCLIIIIIERFFVVQICCLFNYFVYDLFGVNKKCTILFKKKWYLKKPRFELMN